MTLAIAITSDNRKFGLMVAVPDLSLVITILAVATAILSGLCADLATGAVIGTYTLLPAALSTGVIIGFLVLELLGYGQQDI